MSERTIVESARSLIPLIREKRLEGEAQARLASDVVEACGEAGLFRMGAPKENGGLEATPTEIVAATELVSSADPAIGWCIQNSLLVCHNTAALCDDARQEIFAHPNHTFGHGGQPTGKAVPEGKGFRLSGTWPVVSGIEDSKWAGLQGVVMDGDEPLLVDGVPQSRMFYVPTSEVEIVPTWKNVSAMRNTGSNMVKLKEYYVPAEFSRAPDAPALVDRPYFRLHGMALSAPAFGAVVIGVLGTVIESVAESMSGHTAAMTGIARRDQPADQELIAKSWATYRAMRAGLYEVAGQIEEMVEKEADMSPVLRAQSYAMSFNILDVGRELASQLYGRGTRDAFLRDHPVEQALKDLHAISYSTTAGRYLMHSAGRAMLGGDHLPGL